MIYIWPPKSKRLRPRVIAIGNFAEREAGKRLRHNYEYEILDEIGYLQGHYTYYKECVQNLTYR